MVLKNASNPKTKDALEASRIECENKLRANYSAKSDFKESSIIQAYSAYYKTFRKSYPVLLQLHSVALQGKSIPSFNALVEAMFIAELHNMLLTAGHDLDLIDHPLSLDLSSGEEVYTLMNGKEQRAKEGDMIMEDGKSVISSVIYGPDKRTMISKSTKNLLFVVYAPPGIGEKKLEEHLREISSLIGQFSEGLEILPIEFAAS